MGEISDHERIVRQVEGGEERLSNRRQQHELLEWKASRGLSIDFSAVFYTKFKSKLFTVEADRFMAERVLKVGTSNITKLREEIRDEPMFRFDHYLRTRNETELNKRMASIYKLIEKEKDSEGYEGRKRERLWEEEVAEEGACRKRL